MAGTRVGASAPAAAEAALKCSASGGNAIDCTLAGFFAAAGATAGVLLAPLAAIVGGVGMRARCIDGRAIQGGSNLPRPRGFRDEDEIPDAAHVAVSRSLPALALLQAYGASRTLLALSKFGERAAKGSPQRAAFIAHIGRRGVATFRSEAISSALLGVAGQGQGGLLSETDLLDARPGDDPLSFQPVADGIEVVTAAVLRGESTLPARPAQVIVAADPQGRVCALSYLPALSGLPVEELGVSLPRDGEPVRRGTPRITPGTPRPAHFPLAMLRRREDGWFAALGVEGGPAWTHAQITEAHRPALNDMLQSLRGESDRAAVAATVQRQLTDSVSL
ncbi:MAG: hypothetical protein VB934_18000 [Polyangiaceae bacterium]